MGKDKVSILNEEGIFIKWKDNRAFKIKVAVRCITFDDLTYGEKKNKKTGETFMGWAGERSYHPDMKDIVTAIRNIIRYEDFNVLMSDKGKDLLAVVDVLKAYRRIEKIMKNIENKLEEVAK